MQSLVTFFRLRQSSDQQKQWTGEHGILPPLLQKSSQRRFILFSFSFAQTSQFPFGAPRKCGGSVLESTNHCSTSPEQQDEDCTATAGRVATGAASATAR